MLVSSAESYAAFCQAHAAELPLFFQPWWLDTVGQHGTWQRYVIHNEEGEVIGIWPVFTKRGYGFHWHTLPPYTSVSGPWFAREGALTQPLFAALTNRLADGSLYWLLQSMRYVQQADWWQNVGFEVDIRHTYQLPPTADPEELFRKFRTTTRNEIRKATRHLEVRSSTDLQQFMPLYVQHARAKRIFMPSAAEVFQSICANGLERGQGKLLCAYDGQENLHAGLFIVWDQRTSYLLVISRDRAFSSFAATRLLLWHALQQSATSERIFDFNGGDVPSIGDFFAAFGAKKTPYLRATLYQNAAARLAVKLAKYVLHPQDQLFR